MMHPLGIGKPLTDTIPPFMVEGVLYLVGNDSDDFAVALNDENRRESRTTRPYKCSAIKDAIVTMCGRSGAGAETALFLSCFRGFTKMSRWGAMKLAANSDRDMAALHRDVRRLFSCLKAYARGRSIIVERCGDGCWQFWLIRNGFSAHSTWRKLLTCVARDASVECEIFPSDTVLGMRAPGSWDPKSGSLSQIFYADVSAIFPTPAYDGFTTARPLSNTPAKEHILV